MENAYNVISIKANASGNVQRILYLKNKKEYVNNRNTMKLIII